MTRRKEGARAWVRPSSKNADRKRKDWRWEVMYEDPNADFKRRTKGGFTTRDAADDWRTEFLSAAKSRTGWHDPARGDVLFKDVAEAWFDAQVFTKANTERSHRRIIKGNGSLLRARFGNVRIGDIKHSHVREWVKAMVDVGKATSTIGNNFYSMRLVMRYAVNEGLIAREPTIGVKLPKQRKVNHVEQGRHPLTQQELRALCEALPEPWNTYTRLAAATGMRPEEVAGLQVRDFDSDNHTVRVERVWAGGRYEGPKTELSRRTISLDTATTLQLEQYLRAHVRRAAKWFTDHPAHAHPGERLPLFVGVGEFERGHRRQGTDLGWLDFSKPVKHGWFYMRYWKTTLVKLGLPEHLRFYDLRHAHASMIAANIGKPGALTLKECQERLGHSNMSTFYDRYVHSPKDEDHRQRNALDSMWDEYVEKEGVARLRPA